VVHTAECAVARKLQNKDAERFIGIEWADEPVRPFQTSIVVIAHNGKGVLARIAASLARAEADIMHIDMGHEAAQESTELRFLIAVRDTQHLSTVTRALARTADVMQVRRLSSGQVPV
jgi:guanosine-3',5'-bis(diphosphate) 3'-pyrophosphohydrolase